MYRARCIENTDSSIEFNQRSFDVPNTVNVSTDRVGNSEPTTCFLPTRSIELSRRVQKWFRTFFQIVAQFLRVIPNPQVGVWSYSEEFPVKRFVYITENYTPVRFAVVAVKRDRDIDDTSDRNCTRALKSSARNGTIEFYFTAT